MTNRQVVEIIKKKADRRKPICIPDFTYSGVSGGMIESCFDVGKPEGTHIVAIRNSESQIEGVLSWGDVLLFDLMQVMESANNQQGRVSLPSALTSLAATAVTWAGTKG